MKIEPVDISIIVPCRNEKKFIKETIRRIVTQEGTEQLFTYELLIIDGKSNYDTVMLIEEEMKQNDKVKLIINEKKTTPVALNLGIKKAMGKYICILGAHAEISTDYLMNCLTTISKVNSDNVGGPWKAVGQGYRGEAIALAFQSPFAVGGAKSHRINYEGYVDTVWGGFYRREVFDKIGLFDEELIRNQDDELNYRLIKNGGKIWQSPSIKYNYICRNSIKSLFLQYMQYGYWKVRVIQKHKIPSSIRHLIPGAFVGALFFLAILSVFSEVSSKLFLGLISTYIIFVILASLITCIKSQKITYLPIMPAMFVSFHVAYGIGFLKGILDFIILKKHKRKNIEDLPLTR